MTTRQAPARRIGAALILVLVCLAPAGCARSGRASTDRLSVSGSTTILPIAEVAAESYQAAHPGVRVLVAGVGSSAGIESVTNGTSDIGTSSRELKGEELKAGLVDTPIAYDAIAVIVNPSNPVTDLAKAQVAAIFTGKVRNWKQVGGPDMPILLVNRDAASGTREAFDKIVLKGAPFDPSAAVLPGTGQVRSVVGQAPGAVGYISLGYVTDQVKTVAVDGVEPTPATVRSGSYPVRRVLHFFTKGAPAGLAKAYTDYVLSAPVQKDAVAKAGFVPIEGR
jgi:phosphate transport system substrate-binding protein